MTVPVHFPTPNIYASLGGCVFTNFVAWHLVFPRPLEFSSKLLKVVTAILRRQGLRLVTFLDDILLLNISRGGGGVCSDLRTTLDLFQGLGLFINWDKSVVNPTQIIEYLGMMVDSVKMLFSLPAIKVQEVKKLCKQALDTKQVSAQYCFHFRQFHMGYSHHPLRPINQSIEACSTSI